MTKRQVLQATLAAVAGLGGFLFNDVSPSTSGYFVTASYAIIGRPWTPMSYAGVARRTTRRAYYGAGAAYGAYGAAAYGAAVVPHAGCVQVVGPYGGWTWRCY